jgi:hypothetical protein
MIKSLEIQALSETFAVCRLDPKDEIPDWVLQGAFFSITRTADELSIVCRETDVPTNVKCESGWRGLKVRGPLDFSLTGILASLATPLAEAGVSIFAVSTFDTDYVLVKEINFTRAVNILSSAGHKVTV